MTIFQYNNVEDSYYRYDSSNDDIMNNLAGTPTPPEEVNDKDFEDVCLCLMSSSLSFNDDDENKKLSWTKDKKDEDLVAWNPTHMLAQFDEESKKAESSTQKKKKKRTSTTLDILQEVLDAVDEVDDSEMDDNNEDYLCTIEDHQQTTNPDTHKADDEACCSMSSISNNHDVVANTTITACNNIMNNNEGGHDGISLLDEAFDRLDKCMERTSYTRGLIQKAGSLSSFYDGHHHSTPNFILLNNNNKSANTSLVEERSNYLIDHQLPSSSLLTRRKYKSDIFTHLRKNTNNILPTNGGDSFESIGSSSSSTRNGVAPRRFRKMNNKNSSFPKPGLPPKNVVRMMSMSTRKQILNDLRR